MIWERSQAPPENKDSYIHWSVGARRAGRARPSLANPRACDAINVRRVVSPSLHWLALPGAVATLESVARVRARAFTMGRRAALCMRAAGERADPLHSARALSSLVMSSSTL